MSKYGAKKIIVDAIKFDSKMEADFYLELKKMKQDGKIIDFKLQPKYNLLPSFTKNGKTFRKMDYIADFLVFTKEGEDITRIIYDVKGFSKDSTFLLKYKLFNYFYPKENLVLITWYSKRWMTVEEKSNLIKRAKKINNKRG